MNIKQNANNCFLKIVWKRASSAPPLHQLQRTIHKSIINISETNTDQSALEYPTAR